MAPALQIRGAALSGPSSIVEALEKRLSPHGLSCRGVVRFGRDDDAPMLPEGGSAAAVVLIGVVGGALWRPFDAWRATEPNQGGADPLDRWSKIVIDQLAADLGAFACYPSEPPYQPFQTWAMRAEGLQCSPLGILIHPQYGLWHSYRGALLFRDWSVDVEPAARGPHACQSCLERPCLSACPVGAISETMFDVAACRQHLATQAGQEGCMVSGCIARNACPVGAAYRYPPAQLRFHMQALKLPD